MGTGQVVSLHASTRLTAADDGDGLTLPQPFLTLKVPRARRSSPDHAPAYGLPRHLGCALGASDCHRTRGIVIPPRTTIFFIEMSAQLTDEDCAELARILREVDRGRLLRVLSEPPNTS